MSLYEKLNISNNASKDDIKKAYKKLALEHHPDKGGNESKFKEINEAYDTLSDDDKRQKYDLSLTNPNPAHNPFGGFRSDMFSMFSSFGFPTPGYGRMNSGIKLPETEYIIELSVDEVYYGCEKKLNVKSNYKCICVHVCNICGGHGKVQRMYRNGHSTSILTNQCDRCSGHTFISTKTDCEFCKGNAVYEKQELYTITVDPGISENSVLKFEEKGKQALKPREISGDLLFKFKIKDHPTIKIKSSGSGSDINLLVEIDIINVIFGGEIEIKYFDKLFKIDTNDEELILENKDYVYKHQGIKSGDLIIRYKYIFDNLSSLTKHQKNKLKEFYENIKSID